MNLYLISIGWWGIDFRLVVASDESEARRVANAGNWDQGSDTVELLASGIEGPARKLWEYEHTPDSKPESDG